MRTVSVPRYAGCSHDLITAGYPLGNGYRIYLPSLMRFTAPDAWSPFEQGGVNPYTYCAADPVTGRDPSGHILMPVGIAIVATGVIAGKFALSRLARKYGDPLKQGIDSLREDENIGAYEAVHAGKLPPGLDSLEHSAEDNAAIAQQTSPAEEPLRGKRNGVGSAETSARQTSRLRKIERDVTRQLDVVEERLAAARAHRETARLLRRGVNGSHDPTLVHQLASEERARGLTRLASTRTALNAARRVRTGLNIELRHRIDVISEDYEILRRDFDRIYLSNRSREQ